MVVNNDKIDDVKKDTTFAGHFDGHGNAPVWWGAHCLMEQIHGYTRCHWPPPSGKYLHRITPADAMVIDFGSKNWVVALWNRCFEASVQKAKNGPSTQLIKATSCVERLNATIQAKELSYLSSHQMLTMDKNWWSY
jgi:hypothetical protein